MARRPTNIQYDPSLDGERVERGQTEFGSYCRKEYTDPSWTGWNNSTLATILTGRGCPLRQSSCSVDGAI